MEQKIKKKTENKKRQFQCPHCPLGYNRHCHLTEHIKGLHEGRYKCSLCEKNFSSNAYYKKHIAGVHSASKVTCTICKKEVKHLKLHMDTKHSKDKQLFSCPECPKTFTFKSNMKKHFDCIHGGQSFNFSCELCTKKFNYKSGLVQHLKRHRGVKEFKCNVCEKMFASKNEMYLHGTSHSDRKYFTCDKCGAMFKLRNNLHRHKKETHGTLTTCSICNKKVKYIKLHVKNSHESNQALYSCAQCPNSFKNKTYIKHHVAMVHLGIKRFSCDICSKTCYYKSEFVFHLRRHRCVKDFSCSICCKKFVTKSEVRIHETIHKHSFTCAHCWKSYKNKSVLYKHITKLHNKV